MSVPCGLAADRCGRNVVLGTSALGVTLSNAFGAFICSFAGTVSLRLVWFSSLFNFVGGGMAIFPTMLYTIVADVCDPSERSTAFSYLGASLIGGSLIGGAITFYLICIGIWITIYTGLCILIVLSICGYLMPETCSPENIACIHESVSSWSPDCSPWENLCRFVAEDVNRFRDFLALLATKERRIGLMLIGTVLVTFGDSQMVLLQFITNKFQWSWGKAGLLVSIQSACSLALLLVILPLITKLLLTYVGPRKKDLVLARISMVFKIIGICVVARADRAASLFSSVTLSAFGFGYSIFIRGLMTSMVPHSNVVLYALIGFLESVGIVLASPVMGTLYRLGLKAGGNWISLPFLVAAWLYCGALLIISWIVVSEE